MLLDNRTPKASLTSSRLARGFTVAGRQIGQRWYETPPAGGDPPVNPEKSVAKPDESLGDAGKAALQKERDARETAEKEAKRLKKLVDEAEAAKAKVEEDEAVKRGEFEKIATDRQAKIDELEQQLADRDRAALRDKVAVKHGLVGEHADLAEFVSGETEEEMTANAKTLAAKVLPKKAADTEGGKRTGATTKRPDGEQKPAGGATKTYSWQPVGAVTIPDD